MYRPVRTQFSMIKQECNSLDIGQSKKKNQKILTKFFVFVIFAFFSLLILPQKTFAVSVSDNFNRADGGLGSNWTTVTGTTAPQIVSNVLQPGTAGTLNSAFWSADAFANDQWVQGKMPNSTGSAQGPGLAVRLANSRGYFLWFGNSANTVSIWRMDSSVSWTQLAISNTLTVSGNDVWTLAAQGSTLTAYQNGTQVLQTTDTNFTTGSPGVWMFNGGNQIDDWSGGDTFYSVGGTISGLSGTVVLQNNSGDNLSISSNGSFTFNTSLAPGSIYNATVKTYPTGQTCTVTNGSGTIAASNITNISVTCSDNPATTSESDNFNRTDGSLGPNWTDMTEGKLSIVSQIVKGASGNSGDIRTAESYTSDQYSEIETTATGPAISDWIGPTIRTKNGGQDMYVGIYYNNGGTYQLEIYKRVGGSWTLISGAYNCGLLPAGTKLKLIAVGRTISFLQDGVERETAYDTSVTGGSPGIMSAGSSTQADNWSGGNASFTVTYLSTDGNGVESYDMLSDNNGNGAQRLRILRPTNPAAGVRHSFIYVLPVEAGLGTTYGDGLDTLRALDAQNTYNLTIIAPSFGVEPWYADNPNDPNAQQETFMTTELQPWVKANLATSGYEQHWLIGFSKSGIGSMDLFLKHPDLFTLEAAWDWPADISTYDQFGASSANSYGTDANFQANYRLTSAFMDAHKTPFLTDNRIWIGGYNTFQTDVADFDALLTTKGMAHTTETPTSMLHRWDSGWVPLALSALYTDSINLPDTTAPTVTAFTVPTTSSSLTVSITSFTAKDDIGITGYKITESSSAPSASATGWSNTTPTSYTASSGGTKTLYAWAKDAAGNVSTSLNSSVTFPSTSASTSSGPNPNIIPGWNSEIMQGPNFVGLTHFISLRDAQTLIPRNSVHDDISITISQISPDSLLASHVPFPWMQGLNTIGDIYNFRVVSAFNGYPIPQFDQPVIIILPYNARLYQNPKHTLAIAAYNSTTKKWSILPNSVFDPIGHTIATTTKKFSYFVVVSPSGNKQSFTNTKVLAASAQNTGYPSYKNAEKKTIVQPQKSAVKKSCLFFICF